MKCRLCENSLVVVACYGYFTVNVKLRRDNFNLLEVCIIRDENALLIGGNIRVTCL